MHDVLILLAGLVGGSALGFVLALVLARRQLSGFDVLAPEPALEYIEP